MSEDQLSVRAAHVVALRDDEGNSWEEIAEETGVPVSRLRSVYDRGLAARQRAADEYVLVAVPADRIPDVIRALGTRIAAPPSAPSNGSRTFIHGWTEADIRRLYRESADAARTLLVTLAQKSGTDVTSFDLAEALGPKLAPKGWNSIAGILGAVAHRYRGARYGYELQPWVFRTGSDDRALLNMPKDVADVIVDEAAN